MIDKTAIMREAQKYLAKGQIDKAILEWDKIIKDSPDGNSYNFIGDLYLKKGDRKNAVESFHQAAKFFRNEGFVLKAVALYKKVLNLDSVHVDALFALGELSEEKGLATDAIKYYLTAADALSKEGRKDRLQEVYERILSLSPQNIPLRNKIAEIFLKDGLKNAAAREYASVAALYEEKGDGEKAKEYFGKVLEIQPLNKEAVLGMGALYERLGEKPAALRHMKEAAVLFHQDSDVILKYVELCIASGQGGEARECLAKIRDKEPGNIRINSLLAELYAEEGDRQKAWEEYLPIIDTLVMQEMVDEAIVILERFRDIDELETGKRLVSLYRHLGNNENVAQELVRLGDVLKEKGIAEEALNRYREALEIEPENEQIKARVDELTAKLEPEVFAPIESPEFNEEEIIEAEEGADEGAKPAAEIFAEADIFARYGLLNEAIKLLESLRIQEPRNTDLHVKLKTLYRETSDIHGAVTECLILSELFKRKGEMQQSADMLREAFELAPDDPRLEGKELPAAAEPQPKPLQPIQEEAPLPSIEDYQEELSEAEFYLRQGLITEASSILHKLQALFPDNQEIRDKIESLNQTEAVNGGGTAITAEVGETPAAPESGVSFEFAPEHGNEKPAPEQGIPFEFTPEYGDHQPAAEPAGEPGIPFEFTPDYGNHQPAAGPAGEPGIPFEFTPDYGDHQQDAEPASETGFELPPEFSSDFSFAEQGEENASPGFTIPEHEEPATFQFEPEAPVREEPAPSEKKEEAPPEGGYESLSFGDDDLVDAQEVPEPTLDSDVLEIFQEFKKGLEKELGDQDSETHYNLGIAYKEMGLIEDAIKEFQASREDPARVVSSSTMLGVCYMEKGLYSLAIDVLEKAAAGMDQRDESYWAVCYDLADAYEKSHRTAEALDLFTKVYGWNAKFRGVAEKMSQLSNQPSPRPSDSGPKSSQPNGDKPNSEKPKTRKDRVSYL